MSRLLAGLLIVAALFAAAACSSGEDAPTGTPLPSGRTPAPTAPKGANSLSKLASTFLGGVDGKYEYLYTGPLGSVTEGTLTIYRLGVSDRQDWTVTSFEAELTTVSILAADNNNYSCTMAPNYNFCQTATVPELESLRVFSSPIYDALAALAVESDKFQFDDLPAETLAGLQSTCYHASSETRIGEGPPLSEDIKACFTDAGALSYFQRTMTPDSAAIESSTFTLELQAAGEALPSDFEPTGRVQ